MLFSCFERFIIKMISSTGTWLWGWLALCTWCRRMDQVADFYQDRLSDIQRLFYPKSLWFLLIFVWIECVQWPLQEDHLQHLPLHKVQGPVPRLQHHAMLCWHWPDACSGQNVMEHGHGLPSCQWAPEVCQKCSQDHHGDHCPKGPGYWGIFCNIDMIISECCIIQF